MENHGLATLATCALDQVRNCLANRTFRFEGNKNRIIESCKKAKALGARYRLGPELEISGHGCEDHFLESDTLDHSLEVLAELLDSDCTYDLLCDFGLPLLHNGVRYNVRAFCLNGEILCFRPKQILSDGGNHRETRWFARWARPCQVEDHILDPVIRRFGRGGVVPFGDIYVQLRDASIGAEQSEELIATDPPHARYCLAGVDIIGNGSGSHHQLQDLSNRVNMVQNATTRCGGVYLYANHTGCDGGRIGYDACPLVSSHGELYAQGPQFTLADVEVVAATVDLHANRVRRAAITLRSAQVADINRVAVPFVLVENWSLCNSSNEHPVLSAPIQPRYHSSEEEITLGPAIWLWDYLRRSGASGFFLPLSGGSDSSCVATIVYSMCSLVSKAIDSGDTNVLKDICRIAKCDNSDELKDPRSIANKIFYTAYLRTLNSSSDTRELAAGLSKEIGNYHLDIDIERPVRAIIQTLEAVQGGREFRYRVQGGSQTEDIALQNVQARLRMVLSYGLASTLPWMVSGGKRSGHLLVLSSANIDESVRGYVTKYDCSSADINPIGAVSKLNIRRVLEWGSTHLGLPTLGKVAKRKPSPELKPITGSHKQVSEEEMGCTFEELSKFGELRKIYLMGPLSMYRRLAYNEWAHLSKDQVASKVKYLFKTHGLNRHKATVATPSYFCEAYSPDDSRYDLRPFLYPMDWSYQFRMIDNEVKGNTEGPSGSDVFKSRNVLDIESRRIVMSSRPQSRSFCSLARVNKEPVVMAQGFHAGMLPMRRLVSRVLF